MKNKQSSHVAVGVLMLLTAILIIACQPSPATEPETTEVAEMTATTVPASLTTSPFVTVSPTLTATTSPSTETPPVSPTEPPLTPTLAVTASAQTVVQVDPPEAEMLPEVTVTESSLTLPTYPFTDYLATRLDPTYTMPVLALDRPAYEAASPAPVPVTYRIVVLENPYLRLTFLPELGGRLYSAQVKATNQEIFYQNPVVKPSVYGPLPVVEGVNPNWWLATGGMEWAYPVQEHGYRWGVPWEYEIQQTADHATIILRDSATEQLTAEVRLTLAADRASFTINPKLIHQGSAAIPVQFWLNAALTLGSASISPQTQFILPVDSVIVHSRGAEGWSVPAARESMSWPVVADVNLRTYDKWANYLGFFIPYLPAPFMGAYNPETDLGVARFVEPGAVPGSKLFAFSQNFPDRSYTDNNSQYFEIWGGINEGFWPESDILMTGGQTLEWQEQWWPLAGLGGLTWANDRVAVHLTQTGEVDTLTALFAQPTEGIVTFLNDDIPFETAPFSADPTQPLQWQLSPLGDTLQVEMTATTGEPLLQHTFNH